MHITETEILGGLAGVVIVGTAALTAFQQLAIKAIQVRNAIKDAEDAKSAVTVNVNPPTLPPTTP